MKHNETYRNGTVNLSFWAKWRRQPWLKKTTCCLKFNQLLLHYMDAFLRILAVDSKFLGIPTVVLPKV